MSKDTVESAENAQIPGAEQAAADGVSRRRLLRAGLAAAPVVAAMQGTPAHAGACIRPSSFSSLSVLANNKISQGRTQPQSFCPAQSFTDDKLDKCINAVSPALADSAWQFRELMTGKKKTCNKYGFCWYSDTSNIFQDWQKQLARLYLDAWTKNDPENVLLTKQQCADIWGALASNSGWGPFADAQKVKDYLTAMVGGGVDLQYI